MADQVDSQLEFIPTEILRAELLRRCDHGAVVLMRCGEGGPEMHQLLRSYVGNRYTVIGLCQRMIHLLNQAMDETETQGPER